MTWINTVLRGLKKSSVTARLSPTRLLLSELEERAVPATRVWSGAIDNIWTKPGNWDGTAPVTGDDLVFPANPVRLTSVNNFATGKTFGSILIEGDGYDLFGNSITVTNGITTTYTSGVSTSDINIQLGSGSVSVASGGELDLNGAIAGSSGLTLSGGGKLDLNGLSPNTYTGATTVTEGTLSLGKDGVVAVPGSLIIGDGSGSDLVTFTAPDQIADNSAVSLSTGAALDLNNFDDRIGSLTLTGAGVSTGTGTLTLGGNVTSNASPVTSTITGKLDLGGAVRTFAVADNASANPDLSVSAVISGASGGITKTGASSVLLLSGANTYDGHTTVSDGILAVTNANSLGATAAGTTVADGASLLLGTGITFAAEPLTLAGTGAGGIGAVSSPSGANTLPGPITLAGNTRIDVGGGSTLTESGVIDDAANSFSLTKAGSGTLALTNANTFDGGTTVNAGTLSTNNAGALGTGSVTAPAGTSLNILNTGTMPNALVIGGTALTASGSGALTLSGDVSLTSDATITTLGSTTIDFAGAISGSHNLDKTGGTASSGITFSGAAANTFVGTTTIHTGTLTLNKTGVTAIPGDLVLGDSPSGNAVTATLSAADQIADTASVSITAGGLLDLNGFDDTIKDLTLTGSTAQTGAGTLGLTGTLTSTDAGIGASSVTGNLALPAVAIVSVANGSDAVDLTINATITGAATSVAKNGAGTLQFAGTSANTYAGETEVNAGVLELNKTAGQSATGGDLTVADGATVKLLADNQLANTGLVTLTESSNLNLNNKNDTIGGLDLKGATVDSGTGTLTLNGNVSTLASSQSSVISGNLDLGGADRTFSTANGSVSGPDLQVSAIISGTGAGIVKTGSGGVLELIGSNTFDGATSVNSGVLAVTNANSLGATSSGTTVASGATLELRGGVSLAAEPLNVSGAGEGGVGAIRVPSGTATTVGVVTLEGNTTIAVDSGELDHVGQITDGVNSYSITKIGAGTYNLTNANPFNGGVNINEGIAAISNNGSLGTGPVTVADGASLELSGGITPANSGFTISGIGVSGEGVILSSGNDTISSPITLAADSRINVTTGKTLDISGVINDGGNTHGLTKTGAGTLQLAGTNTYTDATVIDAGTLVVAGTIAGPATLNGGTLAGSGTVSGGISTTNPSTVNAGAVGGSGILNSGGNVALASGTTFHADINGTTAGTNYDQLAVTGTINLAGATLVSVPGYVPQIGDSFKLVDNDASDAVSGTFNGLAEGAMFSTGIVDYQISYVGGDGNDVVLTVVGLTYTWTGAGSDGNWSTAANWAGNLVPTPGSDLVFPAGSSAKNSVNDLAGGTLYHSVTIADSGFAISGNAIQVSHGIAYTAASGSSDFDLNVSMPSTQSVSVVSGGTLALHGAFSGTAGIDKIGAGALVIANSANNTYTGVTTVVDGTVSLAATSGAIAIPTSLVIGNATGSAESVTLNADNQIADSASVLIAEGASLNLNGRTDLIDSLALQGASVTTGSGGSLGVATSITTTATTNNVASSITGAGTLDLNGNATFSVIVADDTDTPSDLEIDAVIANGGLVKTGTGLLDLSANNTYAGATTINAGAIEVENDHALGSAVGSTTVASGAALLLNGSNLSLTENLTISGTGLSGSGALGVVSGSTSLNGTLTLAANSQINVASGSSLAVAGVIDDGANGYDLAISQAASSRTTLAGNNDAYAGDVSVNAGFLKATHSNAFGDPAVSSAVSVNSGASLELAGGITLPATKSLQLNGVPVSNSSKVINVSGDNTIAGPISLASNNESFDVASGDTLTISGAISGSVDFDKNGDGRMVLSGTNANTGNVNVGAGILQVDGSLATSAKVFVDGTLKGTGTLPMVQISAIGTLAPGNGPGVITTGSLLTESGSVFSVELNGATVGTQYDQDDVTGSVTLADATLSISLGFIPTTGDVFTIINNDSNDAVSGTFNGLAEGSVITVGRQQFQISYVGGSGNDVTLTALQRIDTWTGSGADNKWSTAGNWASGFAPVAGDRLVFASSASQTTSVNDLTAGTTFESIIVQSSGYSFSGNAIQLDQGITTTYSSGTSTVGLAITLTGNQTVDTATGGTLAISGVVSGAFSLTKSGGGDLILSASNTYGGGTTVNAGTLTLSGASSQAGSGSITVVSGATISLTGSASLANALTIGGDGVGGGGAIVSFGTSSSDVISGNITLTSDLLVHVNSQTQIAFSGTIGGAFGLTFEGGGTISMSGSGSNTYTGTTTQNNTFVVVAKTGGAQAIPGNLTLLSGTFITQQDEQIADSAILTVNSGAEFDLLNANEKIGGIVFNGGIVTSNSSILTVAAGGSITTNASSSTAGLIGTLDLDGGTVTLNVAAGTPPNGNDLSIAAKIQNGSLVKSGAGSLALAPSTASTYSGGTTINAGTVRASEDSSFGAGTVTNNGTIEVSGGITIANDFQLGSSGTAIKNTGGSNTLSGAITLAADTTLDTANSTTLALTGVINDAAGSFSLTKTGVGTLSLAGTNTYDGGTNINAGKLVVGDNQATGTLGTVILATGTTLDDQTSAYALPAGGLQAGAGVTIVQSAASARTISGAITLGGDITLDVGNASGSLELSGAIGDGGNNFGFAKLGAGSLILSQANTYAGLTTISAGKLTVTDAAALGSAASGTTFEDGTTFEINLPGPGTIAEPITIGSASGSATITQTGSAVTLSGDITLAARLIVTGSGGAIEFSGIISDVSGDGSHNFGIDVQTTQVTLSGANGYRGPTNVQSGILVVANRTGLGAIAGGTTVSDGATLKFDLGAGPHTVDEAITIGSAGGSATIENISGDNVLTGDITLISAANLVTTADSLEFSGVIDDAAGTFGLTTSGTGALILSGANTFDGNVQVTAGSLNVRHATALGSTNGSTAVEPGAVLVFDVSATIAESISLGSGGNGATLRNQGGDSTLTGDVTIVGTSIFQIAGGSLRITGQLTGPGGLDKQGSNLLALAGNNNFAGSTLVSAGNLQLLSNGAASTTVLTVADGATLSLDGSLTITPSSLTLTGVGDGGTGALRSLSGTSSFSGPITLTGDTTFATNAGALTLSGIITGGAHALTKIGTGKLVLNAANSYSGGSTINAGIVEIGDASALGSGAVALNAELDLAGSLTLANDLSINTSGTAIKQVSGSGVLSGSVTLLADTTVSVASGLTLAITGVIDDAANAFALTKTGVGKLQLGAANTYDGGTTVSAGTLEVLAAQATGVGGVVTVADGSTLLVSTATYTLPSGGLSLGASTLKTTAASAHAITGAITLTGDATIDVTPAGGSLSIPGAIGGGFGITKTGAGSLTLGGSSSYTGVTTISAGVVRVDGDISSSSQVSVDGGVLTGDGTIGKVVVGPATLTPGNSPGVLHSGDVTLASSSTVSTTLNSTTAGTGFSQLDVTGTVTLGGATLQQITGFVPNLGDVLRIIDNDGTDAVVGTFAGLAEGGVFESSNNRFFRISYVGGTGNDVTLTAVTPTTTVVSSSSLTSVFGQSVTLTATITPQFAAIPAGTVEFYDGATLLGSGTLDGAGMATLSLSSFSVATHSITAKYLGQGVVIGSTSSAISQVVNAADTVTQISTSTPSVTTSTYGDSVTFSALVTVTSPGAGTPAGTVTFRDGSTVIGTGTVNNLGIATYTTSLLNASGTAHAITAEFAPSDGNFNTSTSASPFLQTVNQATLTITADSFSRVYGDANPTLTASFAGFKNGETLGTSDLTGSLGLSTAATPTSSVSGGPYAITAALNTLASGNYSFNLVNGSLTVTKAALTITADSLSREYGDANPTLTASFAGFKNGETLGTSDLTGSVGLSTAATPTSSVSGGPYAITASLNTLSSGNYTLSLVNGSLTVTKAALTITADSFSRAYGDANPTLTASYSGFKNGELFGTSDLSGTPGLSTTATPTSSVSGGPYAITATVGSLSSGNYTLNVVNGSLTVTKAALTIMADSFSRVYGDANPTLTASYAGFKNGESLGTSDITGSVALSTSATPTSSVSGSPYAITASLNTLASGNYTLSLVDGTLTVTKAALTITADSLSREYGDANPTLTAVYAGFKNGETLGTSDLTGSLGLSTAATPTSSVSGGPYAITASLNTLASGNYTLSLANGSLTVTKAVLTVTADSFSRVYGDANPTLTASFSGFKNGENLGSSGVTGIPGLATTAAATSSVAGGPYTISASAGSLSAGNYSFSVVNGALTITKAALTVTANNVTREFGFVNPTFTASYAGFKNGEVLGNSGVTGSPGLTTNATQGSPLSGNPYTITAALGTLAAGNYSFTLVNGTLTITPAINDRPVLNTAPTVIVELLGANPTSVLGAPISTLTANVTDVDFLAVKGIAITSAPATASTGQWEYSVDSGATWTPITGVSAANALLLEDFPSSRVRFKPVATFNGFATLGYKAWDTTTDVATTGSNLSYGNSTVGTAYSVEVEKATVAVGKTNPVIDINGNSLFTSILKDSANPTGDAARNLLGLLATDVERGGVLGLAITSADNTNGQWQYLSGTTWKGISGVSDSSAALVAPLTRIRFLPAAGFFGTASIGFHAWDQSVGAEGERAAVTGTGFSASAGVGMVNVIAKPILDTSAARTLDSAASTALVSDLLAGVVSDLPVGVVPGIAVTGLTGTGTWTYQIGANAPVVLRASLASAVLLTPDAIIQFTPAVGFAGNATLNYRAWNPVTLAGVAGGKAVASGNAFSVATETLSVFIAPTAGNASPAIGNTTISLGALAEDAAVNVGVTVKSMVLSANITDANIADKKGIAVTAVDNTNGEWQFSLDAGLSWKPVGAVSDTFALLLADTARLRFVPAANYNGTSTIDFKAWDGNFATSGDYTDPTVGSAFGADGPARGTITITPVNDTPTMNNTAVRYLPAINTGVTSAVVTVQSLTSTASDVETLAGDFGIHVTVASGPGKWQFSLNGSTFVNLPVLPARLPSTASLRFVGDAGRAGIGLLTYQAWDMSSGVTTPLKTDSLSVARESLTVAVGNATPTLTGPGLLTTISEDPTVNAGDTVIKLLGTTFVDAGVGRKGIAVTGLTTATAGEWQYSADSGKTWIAIGTVSDTAALLLPETARIRFAPAKDAHSVTGTEPTLTYKAWDQTVGAIGEFVDTTDVNLNGFSAAVTSLIAVTSVPDAPVLDTSLLQTLPITGSETVESLLTGAVSSPESSTFGIQVLTMTGTGKWQVNTGSGFVDIATLPANSKYLSSTAVIRFVPSPGFKGLATLNYKAWDATSGLPGLVSTAVETLSVNVGNNQPVFDGL